jgi:hypothetical protein
MLMFAACDRGAAMPELHAERPPSQQHTGRLQGGMMAIGGETTGWLLILDENADRSIEVDVSRVREQAEELENQMVTITGRVVERQYVERGPVPILHAERIQPARE